MSANTITKAITGENLLKKKSLFGGASKMGMDLRPAPRLNIPVGCGFDLINAEIIVGQKGEYIVNGGLPQTLSTSGAGNMFKSTLTQYLSLAAMNAIMSTSDSFKHTLDTENNISLTGLSRFLQPFKYLPDDMLLGDDPRWTVTNKATILAGEWLDRFRKDALDKLNNKDMVIDFTAFIDYRTKGVLKLPVPTFVDVDSLSELEGEASIELVEEKGIDNSNEVFMKQGAAKTKALQIISNISLKTNTYVTMTAQVGRVIDMATGPDKYAPPPKSNTYINKNTKVKGVSEKFFFLPLTALIVKNSTVLMNQTTKKPEYPINSDNETSTDLHVLDVVPYRNKSGASGGVIQVVVSQRDGVLPGLTDFHNCKENGRFGIEGASATSATYNMVFYPEAKLGRTTVRKKVETDEKLERAMQMTHELLKSKYLKYVIEKDLYCEPEVLYKDLIALGYDWDLLLSSRSWYAPDNYHPMLPPYLSIIDLLYARKGKIPYWYDKSKIKKIDFVAEEPSVLAA